MILELLTQKGEWKPDETGIIDLSNFTEIKGPVRDIQMTGEMEGVHFYPRSHLTGFVHGMVSMISHFHQFKGTPIFGVGLTTYEGHSTFYWVQNHISVPYLEKEDIIVYDQTRLVNSNSTLVFYTQMVTDTIAELSCFVLIEGKPAYECISSDYGHHADKIVIAPWNATDHMVFSFNSRTKELECYGVHIRTKNTGQTEDRIYLVQTLTHIEGFDATVNVHGVDLFAIVESSTHIFNARFSTKGTPEDPWDINHDINEIEPLPSAPHYFWAIGVRYCHKIESNIVALVTAGTGILTFDEG